MSLALSQSLSVFYVFLSLSLSLSLSSMSLSLSLPVSPMSLSLSLSLSLSTTEFTLGSFCNLVDVSHFSRLQTLRLDGNEISREDIPHESALCLRRASTIEV